jgi:hypothetical protein
MFSSDKSKPCSVQKPWTSVLDETLARNAVKPVRERLTLIRLFEELHGHG